MIELRNLTKKYGKFCAVDQLDLEVRPGEVFGFLGVNGAGKTTTIRMIAGILQPTSGNISICGYDLDQNPRMAKSITGYIPDRPYLYNKLTGQEFLYFVADLYRVPPAQADSRIGALLEEYNLGAWRDELIESYSYGMKQRLATCAALVHNPRVLVIDEPMVGLDPHGARNLKKALRRYASQGLAIMLSTHSLNVAEEVSDRLAIIHKGALIALGTLDEIKRRVGTQGAGLEEIFLEITSQESAEVPAPDMMQ
jgi:ABC-2 type transport system ATP-binding protein